MSKYILILLILSITIVSGCSAPDISNVPPDFMFILDALSSEEQPAVNINIQINANGEGYFDRYKTGGAIRHDENGLVVYESDSIIETGNFKLGEKQVEQLWRVINENNFFQLNGDYRMAIGYSYSFIMIEANGQSHQVFNIGMEVPEIRAIMEKVNSMLPTGVDLDYREGIVP